MCTVIACLYIYCCFLFCCCFVVASLLLFTDCCLFSFPLYCCVVFFLSIVVFVASSLLCISVLHMHMTIGVLCDCLPVIIIILVSVMCTL